MKYPNCKCTYCNKEIGEFTLETFVKYFKGEDKNGKRKLFCDKNCYNKYIKQFEVEVYNNYPIYAVEVDGEIRYIPYWFSNYYFKNIKDCKKRMDMKNTAVTPNMLHGALARGEF